MFLLCSSFTVFVLFIIYFSFWTAVRADFSAFLFLLGYPVVFLVHGQVTIIFVVSVGLSVCLFVCLFVYLFVQSFSQPSLIRFRSNLDICYMSGSSCVP